MYTVRNTKMYPRILKLWLSIILAIFLIKVIQFFWIKGALLEIKNCPEEKENKTVEEFIKELGNIFHIFFCVQNPTVIQR